MPESCKRSAGRFHRSRFLAPTAHQSPRIKRSGVATGSPSWAFGFAHPRSRRRESRSPTVFVRNPKRPSPAPNANQARRVRLVHARIWGRAWRSALPPLAGSPKSLLEERNPCSAKRPRINKPAQQVWRGVGDEARLIDLGGENVAAPAAADQDLAPAVGRSFEEKRFRPRPGCEDCRHRPGGAGAYDDDLSHASANAISPSNHPSSSECTLSRSRSTCSGVAPSR